MASSGRREPRPHEDPESLAGPRSRRASRCASGSGGVRGKVSPLVVVFAAAFTGAVCLSLGLLIAQALRLRLYRNELVPLAWLTGSAALSLFVFLSLTVWLARPWWFALSGCTAIGLCMWRRAWRIADQSAPDRLPRFWRYLFSAVVLIYGVYTFAYAMAPETSPDGVAYHLGTVNRYFQNHGF